MSLFSFDNHFIFSAFRWGYDVQTKSCQQYNYGGCLGNNNRYEVRPCAQVYLDFQLVYLSYLQKTTGKLRAVDRSTIQFWDFMAKGHSI